MNEKKPLGPEIKDMTFTVLANGKTPIPSQVIVKLASTYALAKQINHGQLISVVQSPTELPGGWFVELTPPDCPTPNTTYMLTIYAWDNAGDMTSKSRAFTTT